MDNERKLPDKLSALIVLAVKDARKLTKDPKYKLNMSLWHEPTYGVCMVCMAGAVMACELDVEADRTAVPGTFRFTHDSNVEAKLTAINEVRAGYLAQALRYVHDDIAVCNLSDEQEVAVVQASQLIQDKYNAGLDGGRAPWWVYLRTARILREVGL